MSARRLGTSGGGRADALNHAVRITLRRSSCTNVENEIFLAENCLEFRANGVARVVFRRNRHWLLKKNRYTSVKFEDGAAPQTRDTC